MTDEQAENAGELTRSVRRSSGPRDTRVPSWTRSLKRFRRLAEELRAVGWPVPPEPEDFRIPPHLRIAVTSTDV